MTLPGRSGGLAVHLFDTNDQANRLKIVDCNLVTCHQVRPVTNNINNNNAFRQILLPLVILTLLITQQKLGDLFLLCVCGNGKFYYRRLKFRTCVIITSTILYDGPTISANAFTHLNVTSDLRTYFQLCVDLQPIRNITGMFSFPVIVTD